MSGRSARSIRRYSLELWQNLVLHGIRKSTFHDFLKYWNFNVLEMALKTLHIVQGLSRTPLFVFPLYFKPIFFKFVVQKTNIWKSGKSKSWKRPAPGNDRFLSSQKCFNFRGVLIAEKQIAKQMLGNWKFRWGTFAWELLLQDLRLGELVSSSWGNRLTATGGTLGDQLPWPGLWDIESEPF